MSGILLEASYRAPSANVWHALTDSTELEQWLMPNDFVLQVGHKFKFWTQPRPGFDGIVTCEVLEIDPERKLSYSWHGGGQKTIVVWELEQIGEITKLTLRQTGFAGLTGTLTRIILRQGWKKMFKKSLAATVTSIRTGSR